jgi:PD-(D/E)XK endonuclease
VLTTDQKGAIAETAIVHAAVKLGIGVYKPISEGGRYDLIFDIGSRLLRVQCKWAVRLAGVVVVRCCSSRRGPHGMIVRRYSVDEIEAIAAYSAATDRCYLLPPRLFAGRRTVHLRLAPSLNNQRALINWASDFELAATLDPSQGAIAQLGERLDGIQKVAGSSPAGSTLTEPPTPGHLRCRQAVQDARRRIREFDV